MKEWNVAPLRGILVAPSLGTTNRRHKPSVAVTRCRLTVASSGEAPRSKPVGIDLGTTNSVIAVWQSFFFPMCVAEMFVYHSGGMVTAHGCIAGDRKRSPLDNPHVSEYQRFAVGGSLRARRQCARWHACKKASLACSEKGLCATCSRGGQVLIMIVSACRLAAAHPRQTFTSVKRLIGRSYDDVKEQIGTVSPSSTTTCWHIDMGCQTWCHHAHQGSCTGGQADGVRRGQR